MSRRAVVAGLVVAVTAAVVLVAVLTGGGTVTRPAGRAPAVRTPAPAPSAAQALRAIDAADVRPHLAALARAARGGNRAAGTPGDAATRALLVARLRAAGWRVRTETVEFPAFDQGSPPRVTPAGGRRLRAGEVRTIAYSPGGRVSGGRVRAVGLAPGRAGDAGCRGDDFAALRRGEVALVQRGTCRLAVKARNAQAAGAAAVLIANDGRPGRTGVIPGTLGEPGVRIPALFVSTAAGADLQRAGRVTIAVDAEAGRRRTANVLAEAGSGPRVVMAGAHLDSVAEGPGLNDDGSGVAALLEVAETLRGAAPEGARVRLGFWGAEELGLHGSRGYVRGLDRRERAAIAAYVNLDMVGTRGGRVAVYAGDDRVERSLRRNLRARGRTGLATERLGGSSDHASFARAGIPVGGIFTGLDRCYHRACDDLDNVDPARTADAAAATAATLLELARDR